MKRTGSALLWLIGLFVPALASAQIDPEKRDLIQLGYNAAFEGKQPISAYAFYYHNQPDFLRTNFTLRVALAPTYLDSELGVSGALAPNTDIGIGLAGGGFADSYNEIRDGTFYESESFDGYGGEMSLSIYHLFDPGREIPLSLVLRGIGHYSVYARDSTRRPRSACPTITWTAACARACVSAAWNRRCSRPWRWSCPFGMRDICGPPRVIMAMTMTAS